LLLLLGAFATVAAGCGGGDGDEGDKKGGQRQSAAGECKQAKQLVPHKVRKQRAPKPDLLPGKAYAASVVTNCGTFEIRLDPQASPRTVGSFVGLAREGFYDGLGFHRIVTGVVIQGGDPRGDGSGGPGYKTRDRPPDDVVYSEGVVAMAKTEVEPPGTAGSQFFVVTSDDAALEPVYALLGRVTKGLDAVHRIESVPAGPDEAPADPVVIKKIDINVK
jgi:cyclophilin family peptidyl-prolyl cis-trans isomerase